jgi:hypothetical protein
LVETHHADADAVKDLIATRRIIGMSNADIIAALKLGDADANADAKTTKTTAKTTAAKAA